MSGVGSDGRIDSLTGLRMLAALAVFGSHISAPPDVPPDVQHLFTSGYNGVTLFFILSGFVLTWNYMDRLGDHMSARELWSFTVARFARVYPMYAVALLLAVAPLLLDGDSLPHIWSHVFAVQAWNTDIGVVQAYNGPAWSVGVEFFLYACFPLLVVAARPLRRRPGAVVAVAAAVMATYWLLASWFQASGRASLEWGDPGSDYRWLYREPVTRLGDFVLGMCAALLVKSAPRSTPAWWGATAQVVSIGAVIVLMASDYVLGTVWSWDFAYMIPAVVLILGLSLNRRTLLARALSTKTMVLLGEASFAFYLLHHIMLNWFGGEAPATLGGWAGQNALHLFVIASTAVGAHYIVEQPARAGIRRLLDRRRTLAVIAAREGVVDGELNPAVTRPPGRHAAAPLAPEAVG
ncbi:acyltransferase family protein [Cellulomonas hominis]|uniref:acyltransferase family protein n=1 Tax=Cellulomonas hominis TaxID=156981 RepID=UPI001443FAA1|nr:acyltransferase [Cellulomonas hominis]